MTVSETEIGLYHLLILTAGCRRLLSRSINNEEYL